MTDTLTPTQAAPISSLLNPSDTFIHRHIGPSYADIRKMLETLGFDSLEEMSEAAIPEAIRTKRPLAIGEPRGEFELINELRSVAHKNKALRSCIGMGYYDTILPAVIQRNILENPGWYTQYTPYQAEISQGRLEALLNFQTMIADLTKLPLANASLLDEATAAAEAASMCRSILEGKRNAFFVADHCHPQTIAVVRGRCEAQGIELIVGPIEDLVGWAPPTNDGASGESTVGGAHPTLCGVLVQYPTTDGRVVDFADLAKRVHSAGALLVVAADLLALTLITPPGEFGADICVGVTQRFGMPMGCGGPHAAYMATKNEYARKMPGRIVGVSKDSAGHPALRLAIQTREQHIRREKATSNICTAQVLPAIVASMYAVYHGPEGLKRIARRIHAFTCALAAGLQRLGHDVGGEAFFDTLRIRPNGLPASSVISAALSRGYNLRDFGDGSVGISLDETTARNDVQILIESFAGGSTFRLNVDELASIPQPKFENRTSDFLTHPVFHKYHAEHELLRYIKRLESRDLSLTTSMIPLGSCTMKLNATTEMMPITWPNFARIHPFAPKDQMGGYFEIFKQLENWLAEITGFSAVSLQPNAGSQGEYAGLLTVRAYHKARGQGHRDVCLIPTSAHGTNPASAIVAGFRVVTVACDAQGNVDVEDLRKKAQQHANNLGVLMITYPSTHGVFEERVKEICQIVHEHGGQVYMDGANMNAQVGLTRPGEIGADVCHLNLHKTFCIPHGGGGPGMGPIAVAKHLAAYLPGDPSTVTEGTHAAAVSAAPYGSAVILTISWTYIALMGGVGLTRATQVAILNANYMAKRIEAHYPVLYRRNNLCAHEFILDCRAFEESAGVKVEDIAKRLMDYGFHAPTMSWPVPGTLMIEPTESESKAELDRLCDALISIRGEIAEIETGKADRTDNVLKNAPHTAKAVTSDNWTHGYSRRTAAYPVESLKEHKFWPAVGRIDNPFGDRNLVCTCAPLAAYE